MKKVKKFNKITIIVLVILFAFIVTMGILVYKNRNTLLPIYYAITNQTDIIEQKKLNTEQRALDAIKEYGIEEVRPLTEDETEKLNNGEITEEEAVDIILGRNDDDTAQTEENTQPADSQQTSSSTDSSSEQSEEFKAKNEEIAQLIGQMYVLKARFTKDLADIEKWVNDQYWVYALEYGEGNVPYSIKSKIGKAAYAKATNLEAECDVKVNDILTRITTLLNETGQSTKIVDEIKAAYEDEKMLAKSKYMSQI